MVLISRKVDYALLILCQLARSGQSINSRELAEYYRLSRAFIANILKQLCQEGFLESQRGVHGGYRLAVDPATVTLQQIITTIDGPFQLMACSGESPPASVGGGEEDPLPSRCGLTHICPSHSPMKLVHDRILTVLETVTLADLARQPGELVALSTEMSSHGCASDLSR